MTTHHHSKVNALINPVFHGDIVIAESGRKFVIDQNMHGQFALIDLETNKPLFNYVISQIGIVRQIDKLGYY